MKVAAFVLVSSSSSAADLQHDCSLWKQRPGMRWGVPKTTSAAEVTVSSRGALRRPSKTQGSDRIHDLLD